MYACLFRIALPVLLLAGALSGTLVATEVRLPADADTYLRDALPDNFGTTSDMVIGTRNNATKDRGLIHFDLSSIPTNAIIGCANLTLTVGRTPFGAPPTSFLLYRMKRAWTETGANGLTSDGATAWEAAGALGNSDVAAEPSAIVAVGDNGSYTLASPNLAADLQSWIQAPESNFGWQIRVGDEALAKSARRVATREALDTNTAPVLVVNFSTDGSDPCTPPAPPKMEGMNRQGTDFVFQFQAEPNRAYVVERSRTMGAAEWIAVTNVPASTAGGAVFIADPLDASAAFYRIVVGSGR